MVPNDIVDAIDRNDAVAMVKCMKNDPLQMLWHMKMPFQSNHRVDVLTYAVLFDSMKCAEALRQHGAHTTHTGLWTVCHLGKLEHVLFFLDVMGMNANGDGKHVRPLGAVSGSYDQNPETRRIAHHLIARGARPVYNMSSWCVALFNARDRCRAAVLATLCALQRLPQLPVDMRRLLAQHVWHTRMWVEWEK